VYHLSRSRDSRDEEEEEIGERVSGFGVPGEIILVQEKQEMSFNIQILYLDYIWKLTIYMR
jgi:hypothetical protein